MTLRITIVGGGISGLATAYAIENKAVEADLKIETTLLEGENRIGGKIMTKRQDGYLLEWGPFGFLDNKPETPKLVSEIGLDSELLRSNDASRKRYIFTGGELKKLPENPPAFIKSNILSFGSKARILKEPWSKPAPAGKDETIAEFTERHLGKEAVAKLIDPMATGIFAGSADTLSLKSCLPVMADLEKEGSGSLIKAMMRRRKKKKAELLKLSAKERKARGGTEMGGGILTSFKEGMETFTSGLGRSLQADIISEAKVERIEKDDGNWNVILADNKGTVTADIVVLAVPSYAAADIIKDVDDTLSDLLRGIPYVSVNMVNLGYDLTGLEHDLDGFGFLIPGQEKRKILGAIWSSSIFDGFAPTGKGSLRVMLGGSKNPDVADYDDKTTLLTVQQGLKETMGISTDPEFINIIRHNRAIPQYIVGHGARLSKIDERVAEQKGLYLTGNAYRGIGVNDCTRNARILAERLIEIVKD